MLKIILNIFYNPIEELKNIIIQNKNIYVPVNGGSLLKSDEWCQNNIFFDDDCDDSFSSHNRLLNELTSIWWFYKNLNKFNYPEYIGFNHYRRFFNLDNFKSIDKDIYVAKPIKCNMSIAWQYGYYHNHDDLMKCINLLSEINPEFADGFYKYIRSHTDNFAPCNMFVMKRELFIEWVEFIFPIMLQLEKIIDLSNRDNYQKRALCFLGERIFGYWAWLKCQNLTYSELEMIEYLNFKNNNLNERGTYG